MRAYSDEQVIEQCKKGSPEAFAELVRRHQGTVYSLCYRMTGNAVEAEDLAQEAFWRVYQGLGTFRRGARLRPWLHRLTANVCLDALRKRKPAMLPLEEAIGGASEPQTPHGEESPEQAYLRGEERLDVQQALLHLPGEYRIVLVLRYLEELSYREIAETLNVPVSTVETRIYRAKKMLSEVLSPVEGGKRGT